MSDSNPPASKKVFVPGRVTHVDVEIGFSASESRTIKEWFDIHAVPDFLRAACIAHHEAGPSPWFPLGHERDLSKQITEADFNAALNAASAVSIA